MSEAKVPQRWVQPPAVVSTSVVRDSAPPFDQESALRSILQLVALVRRHWMLIGLVTATVVGVLVYRMRNEPRIYEATAVIRLTDKAREISGGIGARPIAPSYRPYTDPVLSQIQVLRSQAVAESVAVHQGLRLRTVPRLLPPMWLTGIAVDPTALTDTLSVDFGDDSVRVAASRTTVQGAYGMPLSIHGVHFTVPRYPGFRSAQLTLISAADAANEVRGGLSATPRERTDVIDVSYAAPDPVVAERIANAIVREFQAMSAQTAKQESVLRRQFIAQQLAKTETLLADARDAHNAFRNRERVYSSQDKFRSQESDLATIELKRQELIADRGTYQSLLNELQSGNSTSSIERLSALAASPGIATNPVVSQLFSQLLALQSARDSLTTGKWGSAPGNPDVQRLDALIASSESKVVNAVRANVTLLDARIASLDQQKRIVSEGMAGLPQAEAEEATLLAAVTTYSRQVDRLRDELQSAEISEAAEAGQVEIVDLAQASGVPIGTGRRPKLILALVLGLVFGIIIAYVVENYRPVIRRRDELEQALSLPNLALVPQIRRGENGHTGFIGAARRLPHRFGLNGVGTASARPADLVTLTDARSSGAEAYRTLRTNLLFSAAVHSVHRIVVTSPGPEEGKSTTAANLAIAFAQQGHRVLLIDCDLRRARIHKIFEDTNLPGLTNLLVGNEPIPDAIRATRIEGLMILPSGPLPPNPAELLGSAQMSKLLDRLSESYDLLVLDTPPLLAASDAAIVSRMTDGALVVVRAGRTEKSALQTAVQQLATVGARVLGTVLNDPDAEVPKYARYYGYYYNNYYEYSNGNGASA